jgi:FKBP-type peptidyl-prolyl cis-trans isomerase FkpA
MKRLGYIGILLCLSTVANATVKDSTINYTLPDSVKAIQFMAEITIKNLSNPKHFRAGISTNLGSVYLYAHKGKRGVSFQMHELSRIVATGPGVKGLSYGGFNFDYKWETDKTYKLMVAMAADSADNICIYSAYIFLPDEKKWKFIGSRRHPFFRNKLEKPSTFLNSHKKSTGNMVIADVWCQRSNGSWKYMKEGTPIPPTINYVGHIDSILQRQKEIEIITGMITTGKTDAAKNLDGVYYSILKEGTGRLVALNDTVIAHYKGYLFSNGSVFDQTKEKPATFPLNRLIKGWQVGVPLCKVGGKIKLVIPSDLAYSIRTRAAKIPPNSILVFEIEIVDVKPPL